MSGSSAETKELLRRSDEGDAQALQELLARHRDRLVRMQREPALSALRAGPAVPGDAQGLHSTAFRPHEVLLETKRMLEQLNASSQLTSDHYTNYINLEGMLPLAKPALINMIEQALQRDEGTFRPIYIGNQ